jgi:hypothetical protein
VPLRHAQPAETNTFRGHAHGTKDALRMHLPAPPSRTSRVVLQAKPLMAATKQVHSLAVHASVSGGVRRLAWWYRFGGKQ